MNKHNILLKISTLLFVSFLSTSCSTQSVVSYDIRQYPIKAYCEATTPEERLDLESLYSLNDWTEQELPINYEQYLKDTIKIVIADNEEFINPFYLKVEPGRRINRGFCVPGKKHYYRVYVQKMFDLFDVEPVDNLEGYLLDEEGSFEVTSNIVRFCNVDGMKNVRDLGGWITSSGKRINYQKLYRGANFQNITETGKYEFSKTLGIKTEIDLRHRSDRPDRRLINDNITCSLGKGYDISYIESPIAACSSIYPQFSQTEPVRRSYFSETKNSLYTAFTKMSDESNYPMYFHCNAGADRTGTFAFLVEALLGVSIDDLCLDYELTCFSGTGGDQWRGPVDTDLGGRVLGTAKDDNGNYCAFGPLIENMLKWYGINNGAKDNSLSGAVENYLTSFVGISKQQIQSIKNILLS